jgi:hypothetical protein
VYVSEMAVPIDTEVSAFMKESNTPRHNVSPSTITLLSEECSLGHAGQTFVALLNASDYHGLVTLESGKLKIQAELVKALFNEPIKRTTYKFQIRMGMVRF